MEPKIKISDYTYNLPEDKIAKYPLEERDSSKLLVYKNREISKDGFVNLSKYLPKNSIMVFNNTKVVPARLLFKKQTGAIIEIFCLEPVEPADYVSNFASIGECCWNVVIGNAKRWKNGTIFLISNESLIDINSLNLRAELVEKENNNGSVVKFKWDGSKTFSEVLDMCGKIPIPPYLKRDTESLDYERYQTLYAKFKGSVAAPTAGLHFTERVLKSIEALNIDTKTICLHVGAGTFVPVKSEYIAEHKMHSEPFEVTKSLLYSLLEVSPDKKVISVGTTSTRCLESLYYLGVQCIEGLKPLEVSQWEPYIKEYNYSLKEAILALIKYMDNNNLNSFISRTSIIIVPSYKFRIVDVLITNFHQPQSTLLLLISAFIGEDWRNIYNYALNNNFRFLSYGDSSLLFRI